MLDDLIGRLKEEFKDKKCKLEFKFTVVLNGKNLEFNLGGFNPEKYNTQEKEEMYDLTKSLIQLQLDSDERNKKT